jgi:hypothetical protein
MQLHSRHCPFVAFQHDMCRSGVLIRFGRRPIEGAILSRAAAYID